MTEHESYDTTCPNCQIGRITQSNRPYIDIADGHLFTIPKGICYTCDVCDFSQLDKASKQLLSFLVVQVMLPVSDDDSEIDTPTHISTAGDDVKTKPIQVLPS